MTIKNAGTSFKQQSFQDRQFINNLHGIHLMVLAQSFFKHIGLALCLDNQGSFQESSCKGTPHATHPLVSSSGNTSWSAISYVQHPELVSVKALQHSHGSFHRPATER